MSHYSELDAAKRDLPYLLAALDIDSAKSEDTHAPCGICGGSTCLQFGPDKKKLGEFYWHCNKCKRGGDVVDALVHVRRMDLRASIRQIQKDFRKCVESNQGAKYYEPT